MIKRFRESVRAKKKYMLTSAIKTTTIEKFNNGSVQELAAVVATAMLHNPLHLAVFKSQDSTALQKQKKLFYQVLNMPACNLVVAKQADEVVGVMNFYLPGKCQIDPLTTISLIPRLYMKLGSPLKRVLKWKQNWAKHDDKRAHLHLGPLAVLPHKQGQGIGSGLLHHFCEIADARKADAYLETDRKENLALYQKFGFKVIKTDFLFGVENWFMWRQTNSIHE
jgi:ribosomal protein S18 acetylase RimI-like enzyme